MDITTPSVTNTPSALEAYLGLLIQKGASDANIFRRRTFLTRLLKDLVNLPNTEKVYGALVEEKLVSFGQDELRHFFQVTAREFYWFWINDADKVGAYVSGKENISVNPFRLHLAGPIDELHVQADAYFNGCPSSIISTYAASLAMPVEQASMRLKYARLLLFVFRDFEQHPDMFRAAVSALTEKFSSVVTRETFLVIVREFYPIWMQAIAGSLAWPANA